MLDAKHRFLSFFGFLGIVVMFTSCKNDDIPTTPAGPFLLTRMRISKDTTPTPGTTLNAGQTVGVHFTVDYTLSPEDDRNKTNLALFINAFSRDQNNNYMEIGIFPDKQFTLTAASGMVTDTLSVAIPATATSVTVEAFIDTLPFSNPVLTIDDKSWPAK